MLTWCHLVLSCASEASRLVCKCCHVMLLARAFPHLLEGPEPVCDVLPAYLLVAAKLNLDACNGGHLQLPHILLEVVTASIRMGVKNDLSFTVKAKPTSHISRCWGSFQLQLPI